ncbi:hypothetical protein LIER_32948 [Lithospermum erythrorhizon]|uniref:Uncharacterized protein n=1 Tax=Lithospermum erythrorhizon TaxID=34254 RepID=A0AAV3RYQ3_LITER
METKLHGDEWDYIKNKLKMPQALLVDANARQGGLALLWNCDLDMEVLSFSLHHIEAVIKEDGADPWRMLIHLSSNTSDHLPLLLNKGTRMNGIKRGKARFRFESSSFLYKETTEAVRTSWNKNRMDDPGRNLFGCIQNSRLGLLKWKRDVLGNVQQKIDLKQAALDRLNQGTITNVSKVEAISLSKKLTSYGQLMMSTGDNFLDSSSV